MQLPSDLKAEVCVVIQDTGYCGSAEDYVKEFYNKPFAELTTCEAEMIVNMLKNKPGCLAPKTADVDPFPNPDTLPQIED